MRRIFRGTTALLRGNAFSPSYREMLPLQPARQAIISHHLEKAEVKVGAIFLLPPRGHMKREMMTDQTDVVNQHVVKAAATDDSQRGKALRKMTFGHPALVLMRYNDWVWIVTLTNAASIAGYGPENFLPICTSLSPLAANNSHYACIKPPPGMRTGGWVFLGEIYRIRWQFLKIWIDSNQIPPTGQREFELSQEALQQVFRLVNHLHVPASFWT